MKNGQTYLLWVILFEKTVRTFEEKLTLHFIFKIKLLIFPSLFNSDVIFD